MLLDTPVCEAGLKLPDFTLNDADGRSFTLSDHLGDKGCVVAFICNHCPYVKAIANRLAKDAEQLQQAGIAVLAVMPNDYHSVPADNPEQMKSFAQAHAFTFPYLVDEDQSIARAFGAVCTPDFFGLNSAGTLQYRGRLDDAKMGDASNRIPDLVNAMLQIAETGTGPENQFASMGCSIKWR